MIHYVAPNLTLNKVMNLRLLTFLRKSLSAISSDSVLLSSDRLSYDSRPAPRSRGDLPRPAQSRAPISRSSRHRGAARPDAMDSHDRDRAARHHVYRRRGSLRAETHPAAYWSSSAARHARSHIWLPVSPARD